MNKNNIISIFTLLTLLFCRVNIAFSQEWEAICKYSLDYDTCAYFYDDAMELSNDMILVNSSMSYKSGFGDFYSAQPALTVLSSSGKEIVRKDYFRPGYCTTSSGWTFENKNGELFLLTAYNPDHDFTYFNYFKNYDNPPSDAKICLYKLNEDLSVAECYEHSYPIDTYEANTTEWEYTPNELSGRIYMFSVFEDDDNITGAYFKMFSSKTPDPTAKDTLFLFKMDFKGNFLLKKGYTLDEIGLNVGVGGQVEYIYHLEQLVKTDSGYIMYSRGTKSETHGVVDYFDNEFNHIAQRYIQQTGIDFEHTQSKIYAPSVARSKHNTTYLSTQYQCEEENMIPHIKLYEIDDNLNDTTTFLPIVRYITKASNDIDRPAWRAVCTVNDSDLYFVYTLNIGYYYLNDSWIVIEKLNSDFDTITTYFYDEENGFDMAKRIKTAKDGGVIMVSSGYGLDDTSNCFTKVTKFNSYLNIEEAHAHNLHLAVAYPNPGGDVMNIRTGLRNAVLSVYDMQGRKIHQQEITDDLTSVDASKWQSGTYIWKLGIRDEELGIKVIETGKWIK